MARAATTCFRQSLFWDTTLQEPVNRFLAHIRICNESWPLAEISAWSWRAWCGRAWRWRTGRCASLGAAAPFAFAGVLAFATIVAGLATALTLALVLAFASVFALFSISHRLERDPRMARGARCIGTHGQGSS